MSREITPDFAEAPRPDKYAKTIRRTREIARFIWGLNVVGQENVPLEGPGIIAPVHRSYLDPWFLGISTPRFARGMAKQELRRPYYLGLGRIYLANRGVFFVNRKNMSKETYEISLETLRSGLLLVMAPESTSRNRGPDVGATKKGVGRIALMAAAEGIDCPIVPVATTTEHLWRGRPIQTVFGPPVRIGTAVEFNTVHQRKVAAQEINEQVKLAMQTAYGQALELRET